MSLKRYFAFAVLVMFAFMTNVGLWSDHSNWLTHDLEHSVNIIPDSATAEYASLHDMPAASDTSASSSSAIEHELLHAANHLQFFLAMNSVLAFLPAAKSPESCRKTVVIPCASSGAPFRPPRIFLS
ncbi:hypothetical protein [Herminiimonas sp. KBW02]|uniref:hypothetical protein n=1 Tax=Herminiimonas sp. KBW02 TaxID=2153363 RepID=UPI001F3AB6A0|nr:hypothetical protein [Herminiimonas sp. KBW02]